ncbi:MAG: response regulator [Nitrospiraceae bacterium]|nr:MAG: response regulator [Nitrospiraceae bacterium]
MITPVGNRILLVDDDRDFVDAAGLVLAEQHFEVITCCSADEALDHIKGSNIHVVLTDIKMPGVSGIELLEKIHALNSHLPVILMTGYAELGLAVDAIRKGAIDFIMKPSHPDYLVHAVKKALQHRNLIKFREDYKQYLEDIVRQRTHDLELAKQKAESFSRELVERLTTIAEFRDYEEGLHVKRTGILSELIF